MIERNIKRPNKTLNRKMKGGKSQKGAKVK